jgi:L-ascorbate 6-phosphate lactonase
MMLMQEIHAYPVEKGSIALWWLGQNDYIFKTSEGTLLATDMYLTNNCAHVYQGAGVDLNRRVPILIPPEDLDVDIYACTHNHLDHTDPVTI